MKWKVELRWVVSKNRHFWQASLSAEIRVALRVVVARCVCVSCSQGGFAVFRSHGSTHMGGWQGKGGIGK